MSPDLEELVLSNLAAMHGVDQKKLKGLMEGSFAHAWYNDPMYRGAFALFGPTQFYGNAYDLDSDRMEPGMFESLKFPAAQGKLHFAGEATSTHHAWILGALNSAWRAVRNVIFGLPDDERDRLLALLKQKWETPDEEVDTESAKVAYDIGSDETVQF
jgi:monoamine oxidase